jgi:hypothetical protein
VFSFYKVSLVIWGFSIIDEKEKKTLDECGGSLNTTNEVEEI